MSGTSAMIPVRSRSIASIVRLRSHLHCARREWPPDHRGKEPQREDPADGGRRAGQLERERHECDGSHPVAEAGDRLSDEEVAKTAPAHQRGDAHVTGASSRSKSNRRPYARMPASAGRPLPSTRFVSIGTATNAPASAPDAPFVIARTGVSATSAAKPP